MTRQKFSSGFLYRFTSLAALLLLLAACTQPSNDAQKPTRSLKDILESGKLVVLTRNAPTSLFIDRDGKQSGPEHDLVESFAASLNLEVEYVIKKSVKEIIDGIENAQGDMAAAGLTITSQRQARFLLGPAYQDVTQKIVCWRDKAQLGSIEDLAGLEIVVIAGSSYVEQLESLQQEYPDLAWKETATENTEQLLHSVWQREIDCTVADSNIADINRRYYPELTAPLDIHQTESLGWMMSNERKDLKAAIDAWFKPFRQAGDLASLLEKYYGFFEEFDYVDTRKSYN